MIRRLLDRCSWVWFEGSVPKILPTADNQVGEFNIQRTVYAPFIAAERSGARGSTLAVLARSTRSISAGRHVAAFANSSSIATAARSTSNRDGK